MKTWIFFAQICSFAWLLSLLPCSFLSADEREEAAQIQKEIENWKSRYREDLAKLKEKVQQLKDKQAKQRKTLPHTFDRLLDKYIKQGTEPITWTQFLSPKNKIKFYGFMRLDLIYDSHRTNDGNLVFFVNNHNPSPSRQDEEINFNARLTRFGVDLKGTTLSTIGNPELSGKIEIDFYGGGRESANLIRMRHAYLELKWTEHDIKILAGQTADLASPLFPDSIDWNGVQWNLGNTGDRRPQLRFSYTPSVAKINDENLKLSFEMALLRTEAVGGQDIDGDGNNDGEDSGLPMVQWRVGADIPALVAKKPIQIGFWGSHGWEESQADIGTNTKSDFISLLLGMDFKIPLHDRVTVSGEWWWGRNVNDLRGGIGQGIDTFHGKEIDAWGGWFSTKIQATDMLSVSFGYTFDNPQDEDVEDFGATGRRFNQMMFINNVWDFGSGVSVGYEYEYILTYYNRKDGSNYDNRAIVYFMYKW